MLFNATYILLNLFYCAGWKGGGEGVGKMTDTQKKVEFIKNV